MKFPLGRPSLPETNIFAPEMDGWKTGLFVGTRQSLAGASYWLVSGRVLMVMIPNGNAESS